jgi:coenzyme F420-reducing hydrogenase alpha subunit
MTDTRRTRSIDVDYLARVEGEGSLKVRVVNDVVEEIEFGIFEPPRFFEAFMRGRRLSEAPDITARICGICPVAYQMSSVHAMEDVLGLTVGGPLRALRRLLYCGEWIESHVLHVYMLHAPDFLGYESVIHMAADHPDVVTRGLRLKKAGNTIVSLLGGREIHPINVKVGGFYRAPTRGELGGMVPELEWARDAALETVQWAAALPMPQIERDFEFVSLRHPDEYPLNEGRIVSSGGIDIDISEYNDVFEERHVARSNALQSVIRGRGPYHVGPLARYNLNFDLLHPLARDAALEAGLTPGCRNPFQSILVRAVETVHACAEALEIIATYEQPEESSVSYQARAGTGHGATEAPRGLLYHRYEIDGDGRIATAQIVPPTSQNQLTIEDDVRAVLEQNLDLPDDELQWRLEQTIRNYDPCISCATHFLNLDVERVKQ